MTRVGGVHIKWYQRHLSHMSLALDSLEAGDSASACFHAYQAVATLLSGVLGLDPYDVGPQVKTLASMLKTLTTEEEAVQCAKILEYNYFAGRDAELCIKCAEILTDYLHNFLNKPS
ncbi:MAG: HEPN domain-containing protein [Pyrobaculum sp.]